MSREKKNEMSRERIARDGGRGYTFFMHVMVKLDTSYMWSEVL